MKLRVLWCWMVIPLAAVSVAAQTSPTSQAQPRGPQVVVLRKLANLYQPVPFNHASHAQMAEMWDGCTTCHHRNPTTTQPSKAVVVDKSDQNGSADFPACKSCHEVTIEVANVEMLHIGMPTLKGAYHRQCLNCHRDWADEKSCTQCHEPAGGNVLKVEPTVEGIIGRMHPPIPQPDIKYYQARFTPAVGGNVIFRHKEHSTAFGFRCVNCHRHDECSSCHSSNSTTSGSRPLQPARTWAQSHDPCVGCHQQDRCNTCHFGDDQSEPVPFEHQMTGQLLDKDHAGLKCGQCHARPRDKTAITCGDESCHKKELAIAYPQRRPGEVLEVHPLASAPSTQPTVELRIDPSGATVKRVRRGARD